jgi:hypothetical protein
VGGSKHFVDIKLNADMRLLPLSNGLVDSRFTPGERYFPEKL